MMSMISAAAVGMWVPVMGLFPGNVSVCRKAAISLLKFRGANHFTGWRKGAILKMSTENSCATGFEKIDGTQETGISP
jgi:hypothetical protein